MTLSNSIFTPNSSSPIFSMFDFIPTALNTTSQSIVNFLSLLSISTFTLLSTIFEDTTSELVKILIPFFFKIFPNSFEIS